MRGERVRAAQVALVLLGAAACPAAATSVAELTLDEAVQASHAIVRARVEAAEEGWGQFADAPAITTTYRLAKVEALLGEPLASVVAFGGTVGDRTMTLEGQPQLTPGSEVLLLVITGPVADSPFVGIWQGVYELRAGQVFRGERAVVDVAAGKVILARDNERGMTPEAFLEEVRAALLRKAEGTPPLELPEPAFGRPVLQPFGPRPHGRGEEEGQ